MKIQKLLLLTLTCVGMVLLSSAITWAGSANPPCPQIGNANGCDVTITLNANGTSTINVTGQPPYDGVEDQLVGITNNSTSTISSVSLSGSNIFGFDGDGAGEPGSGCNGSGGSLTYSCFPGGPFGASGYEGPNTSFTVMDASDGNVNFTGGLPVGGTAWFSLEEPPTTGGFTVTGTQTGTPEPGSVVLFATGILGLAVLFGRKRLAAQRPS